MKILKTNEYERFKYLPFNRKVKNITNLKKSISENDLTEYNPIIINRDNYIIDGQHRFEACKALGKPIYYVVCNADAEKAIVSLNTIGRYWTLEEWQNYYANKGGYEAYEKLGRLMQEYNYNNLTNALILFSQGATGAKAFKEGKLKDQSEFFEPIIHFLQGLEMPHDFTSYRAFVVALKNIFVKYYNGKRGRAKIEKLRKKVVAMTNFRSAKDYERAMENYIKSR